MSVCIPMRVSAFVLNKAVVDDPSKPPNWCVGPLALPEYSRLHRFENEVQPRVDLLHHHRDSATNPRMSDVGIPGGIREKRCGIHLHWELPQVYRAAAEVAPGDTSFQKEATLRGFRTEQQAGGDFPPPSNETPHALLYRMVPNRWLIFRRLDPKSLSPAQRAPVPVLEAFLVESNRCRSLSELAPDLDIEVEVSPYAQLDDQTQNITERFLGIKIGPGGETLEETPNQAPRYVPLSTFTTANPLFPDFQPHNANVFSMIDTLEYTVRNSDGTETVQKLLSASVSYTVVGWVDNRHDDILADKTLTRAELLGKLGLRLRSETAGVDTPLWLSNREPSRSICQGTLCGVRWDAAQPPSQSVAHDFATSLLSAMPVAVGSSPLDCLNGFLKAFPSKQEPGQDGATTEDAGDGQALGMVIHLLQSWNNDDWTPSSGRLQSQSEANDRIVSAEFMRFGLDTTWKFVDRDPQGTSGNRGPLQSKQPFIPSKTQRVALSALQLLQNLFNGCSRELNELRWRIFAEWWKFRTAHHQDTDENSIRSMAQQLQERVHDELAMRDAGGLVMLLRCLANEIESASRGLPEAQRVPGDPFVQRQEPSVAMHSPSPWPSSPPGGLGVRLSTQLIHSGISSATPPANIVVSPADEALIQSTVARALDLFHRPPDGAISVLIPSLVREFFLLGDHPELSSDMPLPLYHDKPRNEPEAQVADLWASQPFSPLFVEWEAVYFHIPFSKWEIHETQTDLPPLAWGLGGFVAGSDSTAWHGRKISGRDLVLPEISAKAQAVGKMYPRPGLRSLFGTDDADSDTSDTNVDGDGAPSLPFLSFSLRGLNDHLATRYAYGTHLTPTSGLSTHGLLNVQKEAVVLPTFTKEVLTLVGDEAHSTPYAGIVGLEGPTSETGAHTPSPFIPVVHGQAVITRINIVDRFGQVISASEMEMDDKASDNLLHRSIYPYVSDSLACQPLLDPHGNSSGISNAVVLDQKNRCAFFQLSPTINQKARLNLHFVTNAMPLVPSSRHLGYHDYRIVADPWESPVWGWVVVNYSNHGVQFFLPNGTFYGEVLLTAGAQDDNVPLRWQPFEQPSTTLPDQECNRLEELLKTFRNDRKYLAAFVRMIGDSLPHTHQPGASYSESFGSLTGRCLALVDFGVSLELAEKPQVNESTLDPRPPELPLSEYAFPVAIGERDRLTDGLVAYFASSPKSTPPEAPDLGICFTHFPQDKSGGKMVPISAANMPELKPHYISVLSLLDDIQARNKPVSWAARADHVAAMYERAQVKNLTIFSALLDPFSPVHFNTAGVLPTGKLQLKPWIVNDALKRIKLFVRVGPILSTVDPLHPPETRDNEAGKASEKEDEKTHKVCIPTIPGSQWRWLQPYVSEDPDSAPRTKHQEFPVAPMVMPTKDGMLEPTPYTAIEGYLLEHEGDGK
ncbi:hypothetical protein OQA88_7995 [Cercophora sp. LCS_1]